MYILLYHLYWTTVVIRVHTSYRTDRRSFLRDGSQPGCCRCRGGGWVRNWCVILARGGAASLSRCDVTGDVITAGGPVASTGGVDADASTSPHLGDTGASSRRPRTCIQGDTRNSFRTKNERNRSKFHFKRKKRNSDEIWQLIAGKLSTFCISDEKNEIHNVRRNLEKEWPNGSPKNIVKFFHIHWQYHKHAFTVWLKKQRIPRIIAGCTIQD